MDIEQKLAELKEARADSERWHGDGTCITIYCDYCEQPFEINEGEIDDWLVIDPVSGDKAVMCGECESKSKKKKYSHYETCPANNGGTCSCSY